MPHIGNMLIIVMRSSPCEAYFFYTQFLRHIKTGIRLAVPSKNPRSKMNALDFLFDFAALMSTSSALTHPQGTAEPTQEPQASRALPKTTAPAQYPQLQASVQHPLHLLDASVNPTSIPQSEVDVAILLGAPAKPTNQHSLDWIPAPRFMQQASRQEHDPVLPEHLRLPSSEVPPFDGDFAWPHCPCQSYGCTHLAPPSRRLQHGCMPLDAWNGQQHRLQPLPSESPAYGVGCKYHGTRQLCACQDLSPNRCWTNDGYVPASAHQTGLQYNNLEADMYPEDITDYMQHY